MQLLYFAYGSNLCGRRMRERAPSAHPLGAARLAGHRLGIDKPGRDGTGKANLWPDATAGVWGALYALDADDLPGLDACEPGYQRIEVRVELARSGEIRAAQTYRSELRLAEAALDGAYKRLLVEGALEHGLPAAWVEALRRLPEAGARDAQR